MGVSFGNTAAEVVEHVQSALGRITPMHEKPYACTNVAKKVCYGERN